MGNDFWDSYFEELEAQKVNTKEVLSRPISKGDRKAALKVARDFHYDQETYNRIKNAATYGEMERAMMSGRRSDFWKNITPPER